MLLIESLLVAAAFAVALVHPTLGNSLLFPCEQAFVTLAERRRLAVLLVFLFALILRAAVMPIFPIPHPVIQDEFSYLLAADTFSHGHLTNPSHPMWVHFETFHVIWLPTYMSMYAPAQGLFLALGTILAGHPFVGVWFSVALMCAAICWMLQGWVPPAWALLGGILAAFRFGVVSYWANSYFGGAVAAIGGALVLGAYPRLICKQRVRDAIVMGIGLTLLANSRPYEGLVFSIPFCVSLGMRSFASLTSPERLSFRRVTLPLLLVMGVAGVGMGFYFWSATGSPVRMPYQVNRATYAIAPYFQWQSPSPQPEYRHEVIRQFYIRGELVPYLGIRNGIGFLVDLIVKPIRYWRFYFGPLLSLPLLVWALRRLDPRDRSFCWGPQSRFLLLGCIISLLGLGLEVFSQPHYAAPMMGLVILIVLLSLRHLRDWRLYNKPVGILLTRAIPLICLTMFLLRAAAVPLHLPVGEWSIQAWYSPTRQEFGRAAALEQFAKLGGKQLVIVRYGPGHDFMNEWVYNDADIDHAQVVWARDMGPSRNVELIHYFSDRHVWLINADDNPPVVKPYDLSPAPDRQPAPSTLQ